MTHCKAKKTKYVKHLISYNVRYKVALQSGHGEMQAEGARLGPLNLKALLGHHGERSDFLI